MTDGVLLGQVAVITGAASGVGSAAARLFVAEGAHVLLMDRDADPVAAVAAELGDAARAHTGDVANEESVADAVDTAVETFGRLDCMFNNAGVYGWDGAIAETPADTWDETIRVLLRGVFLGTKHAARVMTPQRSGRIIATSSVAGVLGGLGPHAYSAAKAGVIGFTRSVAAELRHHAVTVNCVVPGGVVTPMLAEVALGARDQLSTIEAKLAPRPPLERPALPEDIAHAALWLAGPHAGHVTGHALVVDGGISSASFTETEATRGATARSKRDAP